LRTGKGIGAMMNSMTTTSKSIVTNDLYQKFIDYVDASQKTIETYTRAIRQLKNYFNDNRITAPQRADIIAYRDHLEETSHAASTVQSYITAARLFFSWLEIEGIYPNIAAHVKGAKVSKAHKKGYFTSTQAKEIINTIDRTTAKGMRDYAIISLMITAGLRDIEVSRANIGDIQTAGNDMILFVQGKGRDDRADYVKLSGPVEKAIRAYLQSRDDGNQDGAPLFTSTSHNNAGQRMTTRSISGIAKSAMRAAGYDSKRLTAHSLRHTAVTMALLGGEPLERVQQFARHKKIDTTLIYVHGLDLAKNTCSGTVSSMIF
jgi:integrase/recombinase XerD